MSQVGNDPNNLTKFRSNIIIVKFLRQITINQYSKIFHVFLAFKQDECISIYILLDALVCSIAEHFYELCCILTGPLGRVKLQTTSRNNKQLNLPKHLISYLLSNFFCALNF